MGLEQYEQAFEQLSNRLEAVEILSNEIAEKAAVFKEEYVAQRKVLEILFEKEVNIKLLLSCNNYIEYNEKNILNPLTKLDFYTISMCYQKCEAKTACPE